jgi:hypothetical protein
MTVYKVLIKVHFFLLYTVLYSVFRISNPFAEPSETTNVLVRYMTIGLFIWFVGVNIFLIFKQYKETWDRRDYLSPYVIFTSLITIAVFEHVFY